MFDHLVIRNSHKWIDGFCQVRIELAPRLPRWLFDKIAPRLRATGQCGTNVWNDGSAEIYFEVSTADWSQTISKRDELISLILDVVGQAVAEQRELEAATPPDTYQRYEFQNKLKLFPVE